MRNRTLDLRIPRSDALPLSHRDSTVNVVYYEVHMTRVLHTTGSAMSTDSLGKEIEKDVFSLVTSVRQRKKFESP